MTTVNATYAKQNFGACVADAAKQPVVIEKSGRPTVVMVSYEEFHRLHALEEAMWLQRAQDAAAGGYLSTDASDDFMKQRLARVTTIGENVSNKKLPGGKIEIEAQKNKMSSDMLLTTLRSLIKTDIHLSDEAIQASIAQGYADAGMKGLQ